MASLILSTQTPNNPETHLLTNPKTLLFSGVWLHRAVDQVLGALCVRRHRRAPDDHTLQHHLPQGVHTPYQQPCQFTLLIDPPTHHINTHPIYTPYQQPINPPYQHTLLTHPIINLLLETFEIKGAVSEAHRRSCEAHE